MNFLDWVIIENYNLNKFIKNMDEEVKEVPSPEQVGAESETEKVATEGLI